MRNFKRIKQERQILLKKLSSPACKNVKGLNRYANLWRLSVCLYYKKTGFPAESLPKEWNGFPKRHKPEWEAMKNEDILNIFLEQLKRA